MSASPSRILVDHTYADNYFPSQGEVIVVSLSQYLFGPVSALGSGHDLPPEDDYPLQAGCLVNLPTIRNCTSQCHTRRYPLSRRHIPHSQPQHSLVMLLKWVGGRTGYLAGY
jgi:hypothetical protein